MFKITVVNKRTHKQDPSKDFYIGRPSPLGNPFSHREGTQATTIVSTREHAVQLYKEYILTQMLHNDEIRVAFFNLVHRAHSQDINLVCWCAPEACHGDVLKELIEDEIIEREDILT